MQHDVILSTSTCTILLYCQINEPGCGDGRPYSYCCVSVCNEVVDSSSYHVSSGGFMRGVVLWEPNKPVTIEEFQMPRPKAGEVLIKTKACGVCHSDLHVIKGEISFPSPCAIGHEITGEVVEHGEIKSSFLMILCDSFEMVQVIGSYGGRARQDLPKLVKLAESGIFNLADAVTRKYGFC
ncbi:hypothetical protein SADUNF_Sadunf19G0022500 [Salix dunnii]|uniref:Alcohol dehydrogenase-like N-terminal domain-containing protein n=1 Tax=Salix dunnii TaxID=1413687 RepID=A0A835J0P1_9ROSI|nr:hypothetical protein SADUNF_Sadunf19G0022500 [Salix dunnii]